MTLQTTGCTLIQQHMVSAAHRGHWFRLQPPEALDRSLSATQFVVFRHGETSVSTLNQVEWGTDRVAIAALSHMGGPLFTLEYENGHLESHASEQLPDKFHTGYVLTDYQLAYLPVAAVRSGIRDASLRVTQTGDERQIMTGDTLLVSIHYEFTDPWQGKVTLRHLQYGYSLEFNTIEAETEQ
ncbi:MAG: DUF3261 domain-containing protein [Ketobacteraceae bacterium]|nr:DUF3261 domain-containing protein [Ketobacteraceae bacterium]